jgi:signal transduction histidine kinase
MISDMQYQDLTTPEFVELEVNEQTEHPLKLETSVEADRDKPDNIKRQLQKTGQEINVAELRSFIHTILSQLKRLTNYSAALVFAVNNGGVLTPIEDTASLPNDFLSKLTKLDFLFTPLQTQRIKIGDDLHSYPEWLKLLKIRRSLPSYLHSMRSCLLIPLVSKKQTVGFIILGYPTPDYFNERHERFAGTVARQALTAYERLYERAQKSAVTDERARLARELHDTVTQVLYGVALAANSAEMLLEKEKNPVEAVKQLKEIQNLAQSGLVELRAFILELHPDTLEKEGLLEALRRRLNVLEVSYHLQIEDKLGRSEPKIALNYKEILYRVGLEALNNIVKHAKASKVRLNLTRSTNWIELEIADDGIGFDTNRNFPGHLGLVSMQERVRGVKGEFKLVSCPRQDKDKTSGGTTITIRLPLR